MASRLTLQAKLEEILGSRNVYHQPPSNLKLKIPGIVYFRNYEHKTFADNNTYLLEDRWQITVIDTNPDSDIPRKISMLPKTTFDRVYPADGLYHTVYNTYF